MYILVEYNYGNPTPEMDKVEVETTVFYPDSTEELHDMLEGIAVRRGMWPIDENNVYYLNDIVDVHLIEDVQWEDGFVARKGVFEWSNIRDTTK